MSYQNKMLAGASAIVVALFGSAPANATVSLYAQTAQANNGIIVFLGSDNGAGGLTYSGNYGSFFNSVSAVGAPALASPTLLSQTISVSGSSSGLLSLFVVQSGVSGSPTNILSTMTANAFTGGVNSVSLSTFVSATNPFKASTSGGYDFAATLLATHTFSGIDTYKSTDSVNGINGPYYEVARYDITFGAGGGSANNTINLQQGSIPAVPEPATWAMMLVGFGMVGAVSRNRRRNTATNLA